MESEISEICRFVISEEHGFRYCEIITDLKPEEQRKQINTLTHNAVFFHLSGELNITWDQHESVTIKAGELYFLPRGANISAYTNGNSVKYITARLDHDLDNRTVFTDLLRAGKENNTISCTFTTLPIREPLQIFVNSVKRYIIDGIDSRQLEEMKFVELYVIFRCYYTMEECLHLLYPIIHKNTSFKTFILDNYDATVSIDDLSEKAGMSRSTFDRKFKENFGISPLKWIDIQTRILIFRKASEPNVTVKDIMYEVGVYNPSQFTKLCKRLCGVTPSELIRSQS